MGGWDSLFDSDRSAEGAEAQRATHEFEQLVEALRPIFEGLGRRAAASLRLAQVPEEDSARTTGWPLPRTKLVLSSDGRWRSMESGEPHRLSGKDAWLRPGYLAPTSVSNLVVDRATGALIVQVNDEWNPNRPLEQYLLDEVGTLIRYRGSEPGPDALELVYEAWSIDDERRCHKYVAELLERVQSEREVRHESTRLRWAADLREVGLQAVAAIQAAGVAMPTGRQQKSVCLTRGGGGGIWTMPPDIRTLSWYDAWLLGETDWHADPRLLTLGVDGVLYGVRHALDEPKEFVPLRVDNPRGQSIRFGSLLPDGRSLVLADGSDFRRAVEEAVSSAIRRYS